uniref:Prokineticin domain-containing protein n=1 Tax=Cuerna arida TaxID=1464854 RepID=A0A1B6GKC2_9HEMI
MIQIVTRCLVLLSVVAACYCTRPPYIQCQTSEECTKDSCCVIGTGRYTLPTCRKRRDTGESCRMNSNPSNTTLHYPDGETVVLTGVYYIACPCLPELQCSEGAEDGPRCEHQYLSNHLFDYSWENLEY